MDVLYYGHLDRVFPRLGQCSKNEDPPARTGSYCERAAGSFPPGRISIMRLMRVTRRINIWMIIFDEFSVR